MAGITLSGWPPGATVDAHVPSPTPGVTALGASVANGTASAAGQVTLTGLSEGVRYVAFDGTIRRSFLIPVSAAAAAGLPARQASGRYYYCGAQVVAAAALTASSLRAAQLPIGRAVTLDRIAINITTLGAGSAVRLGLYSDDGNGSPGALLLDAGTVDSSTTGLKEITISQAVEVGWLWLACAQQGGTPPQAPQLHGSAFWPIGFFNGTQTNAALMSGYVHNGAVAGALPATFLPTSTGAATLLSVRVA